MGETPEKPTKLYAKKFMNIGGKEIIVAHEVGSEQPSKLSAEERKARRQDNKAVSISRKKHRRRKKHGRAR